MAVNGTVVGEPWIENGCVCLSVAVDEGGDLGRVEYIGRVPIADIQAVSTTAQKKAALVAAAKAVRDSQVAASPSLPPISGTVTL